MEFELFKKLVQANVLDRAAVKNITDYHTGNPDEKVELDRGITTELENGVIVGKLLEYVAKNADQHKEVAANIDVSKLSQVKQANSKSSKVFNWGLIQKEVEKLGIQIDDDTYNLIINGEIYEILDVTKRITEFISAKPEKKAAKKKKVKEGVDILSMDPNRKPTKCDSSLEIILNTLCRNFQMKPKQCAALLTNNNQYLMHSSVKGLKGNFKPVIGWFEELNSLSEFFAEIIILETKKQKKSNTLTMALNAVKTGCYSHNYEVAQSCLRFITKLAFEFEDTV